MKKVVGVILSLSLVGAFAWAQDEDDAAKPALKLSGSVKSGIQIQTKKDANEYETGARLFSDDVGDDSGNNDGRAWRLDLNGIYDADTWGVKFGLRGQRELSGGGGSGYAAIREAFGWVNLFNKNAKVSVGKIDSKVWNSRGLEDRELSNGEGVRLEITPTAVKGLNIGAAWYGHEGKDSSKYIYWNTHEKFGDFMAATTIGVSYESELFYAGAAYRPEGKSKAKFKDADDDAVVKNQLIFGFSLKAIEPLTLDVEVLYVDGFDKVANEYSNYKPEINLNVGYQINAPLDAGLEAYVLPVTGVDKDGKETLDLELTPHAGYKLGETMKVDLFIPLEKMLSSTSGDKSAFTLSFKPKFTYNFGAGSKLVIFDKLTVLQPSENISNSIQLDFVWSF